MKWFLALNATSLVARRAFWESMILAAVGSAQRHTGLHPHLLWDGPADPFLDVLRDRGVGVVPHRVTFYDALEEHAEQHPPGWLSIASGAFLRTELAAVVSDAVVLYTDCDVLFTGPFEMPDAPALFACAPEFDQGNFADFNTGVMIMNLDALRRDLATFQQWIRTNLDRCVTFDQDAYRLYYGAQASALPLSLNWKPYWGISDVPGVVHFHGPKPAWARDLLWQEDDRAVPDLSELFSRDVPSYVHYVDRWTAEARAAGATL